MSERNDDIIEFDFFDEEPETEQATQRRPALRPRGPRKEPGGRGPRRPTFRGPEGVTPLLRLVLLIALAIFVVVVLVFWVQGCRSESKTNAYRDYMEDMKAVGSSSEQIARDLNEQLTTPGIKQTDLVKAIQGLTDSQEQVVTNAEGVTPPGPLREEHEGAIQALQFRVSGLNGLATAFQETPASRDAATAAGLLAAQAERLVASDVIWDDLFREPARQELARQGISGVAVPDSNSVVTPDLASQRSMVQLVQRLQAASSGGTPSGLHGTGIVSTVVLPAGEQLTAGTETVVEASSDLAFRVSIQNSGDSQEVGVKVTLTIQKTPEPITQTRTIQVINSGETKAVTFENLGQPPFGPTTPVRVEVAPVPGEANTTNNRATYPVVFSLPR
jgi:hypothetical protein